MLGNTQFEVVDGVALREVPSQFTSTRKHARHATLKCVRDFIHEYASLADFADSYIPQCFLFRANFIDRTLVFIY